MKEIAAEPLTADAFAPYGEVLECRGAPDKMINAGLCARFHDRAALDFADGRAGVSLFKAELRALPYRFDLVERHPDGSQCFVPMSTDPFLVIVADGKDSTPHPPRAFVTHGDQAVNFRRGTWHGVLTPLAGPGLFAVIDRIGPGPNLDEHRYAAPYTIVA